MTGVNDDDALSEFLRRLRAIATPTPAERAQAVANYRALCERMDADPAERARIDAVVAQITDDDIEDRLRRVMEDAAHDDDPEDTHDGPAE